MRQSRFNESQVVGILAAARAGARVDELCRTHGISRETFRRWRSSYGGMEVAAVECLRRLDQEHRRLKRALADLALDNQMLLDVVKRWIVTPAARREAVSQIRESFSVSERRACRTLSCDRSSARYGARREKPEPLLERIRELAVLHPREGYRSVTRRLRDEGLKINPKRVLRLRRRLALGAAPAKPPAAIAVRQPKVERWASLRAREGDRFRSRKERE